MFYHNAPKVAACPTPPPCSGPPTSDMTLVCFNELERLNRCWGARWVEKWSAKLINLGCIQSVSWDFQPLLNLTLKACLDLGQKSKILQCKQGLTLEKKSRKEHTTLLFCLQHITSCAELGKVNFGDGNFQQGVVAVVLVMCLVCLRWGFSAWAAGWPWWPLVFLQIGFLFFNDPSSLLCWNWHEKHLEAPPDLA